MSERGIVLGDFIGSLAGLIMFFLIIALFFKFVCDIGLKVKPEDGRLMKRYASAGAVFMAVTIFVSGIIYCFYKGSGSLLDIKNIWNFEPIAEYNGAPSVYNVLTRAFAAVLFERYDDCAFYISALCGMISFISVGFLLRRMFDVVTADRCFILFMCSPASWLLFLPSPYSMLMAMLSLFLYFVVCGRKDISLLIAAASCTVHISGTVLIAAWIVLFVLRFYEKYGTIAIFKSVAAAQAVVTAVSAVIGWGSVEEYFFIIVLPAILCAAGGRWIRRDKIYNCVLSLYLICSAYFLVLHFV